MEKKQKLILRKLLLGDRTKSKARLWAALIALCIGTTLLLLSVMIWWNFRELLQGKGSSDSLGSTFLSISKKITDAKMGRPELTIFSPEEINAFAKTPQVQDVGVLTSNHFPLYASLGGSLGFATEMFVEGVPDRFIDKLPDDWHWQPGDRMLPVILSSEFLNLYNYGFAVSRGLPQLSQTSIKSIAINFKVGNGSRTDNYSAYVVGFSDRISSVLVPQSFIDYGNKTYGNGITIASSRLVVKVKDPSDKAFVQYLQDHDYTTNSEQLRFSKIRAIVEVVSAATGILALLLMGIGALVFILFIELTIARAQAALTLLKEIGYSPSFLGKFMISRFSPLVFLTVLVSAIIAITVQTVAAMKVKDLFLNLPYIPGWQVWLALLISTAILFSLISRAITRAVR